MFHWTLRAVVIGIFLTQPIIGEFYDQNYEQHSSRISFNSDYRHEDASGKALEDICSCDAVEIVTSKVRNSNFCF